MQGTHQDAKKFTMSRLARVVAERDPLAGMAERGEAERRCHRIGGLGGAS